MITAKVICDSVNERGNRLTTFELRYPKFIHGEFMTHRVFSRNASSSRAIPTEKLLAEVRSDVERAQPVFWGKNQKGMQAAEELTGEARDRVWRYWSIAANFAADEAELMMEAGAHKQVVNRILEPFLHINVVCTATEYLNFFGLRLDRAAQPEMRALAEAMWRAYGDSVPMRRGPGSWHLPYVTDEDADRCPMLGDVIRISVARCARVSYRSFETGRPSILEEDLALYERLLAAQPLHASPAEHQATPDVFDEKMTRGDPRNAIRKLINWANPDEHGNFVGWRQYRKMLSGESCAPLPVEYQEVPYASDRELGKV